ncbi:MAG: hypothetical protein ACREEW_03525, partial [Caulobacteraceae bacterium]
MRAFVIGLVAAALAATILPAAALAADKAPALTPEARAAGMKAAPELVTAAGLDCDPTDARLLGQSTDQKTKVTSKFYELVCKNAEGFIVSQPVKAGPPVQAFTCLEVAASPKSGVACILPGNADPKAGLQPLVEKSEPGCQVTAARGIGHNATVTEFEVACAGGAGYIVDAPYPLSMNKPAHFNPCLAFSPPKCTLSDEASTDAYFNSLVSKSGKPCQVKGRRYVGAAGDGSEFFEVACQDGKGYM